MATNFPTATDGETHVIGDVTYTYSSSRGKWQKSKGVTIQEEGTALSTTATTLNFVGADITAAGTGAAKTITVSSSGGGASVSIGTSAPGSPSAGDLWVDSATMKLYVYYTDTDSSQWVGLNR